VVDFPEYRAYGLGRGLVEAARNRSPSHPSFGLCRLGPEAKPQLFSFPRRRLVTTFYTWLAQQVERKDAIGVLSRSAVKDKIFPRSVSKLSVLLLRYDHDRVLRKALKAAHAEWRAIRRAERRGGYEPC
jgi:hypothetical protein